MTTGADIKTYSTKNTPLAAWLISQGFKMTQINADRYPYFFLFNDTEELQKAVLAFDSGQAVGDINIFYQAYRNLLHKIHPKVGRILSEEVRSGSPADSKA